MKRFAVIVELAHRGSGGQSAFVRIHAFNIGESVELFEDGGNEIERRVLKLEIGTGQVGFVTAQGDTEPVSLGDPIKYLGRTYGVTEVVSKDADGRWYEVRAVSKKTITAGA